MKKTFAILILSFLQLSCGQNNSEKKQIANEEKAIQYFMSYRLADSELIEYDIDTLKNFKEVIKFWTKQIV